jgi:hypothetical protein
VLPQGARGAAPPGQKHPARRLILLVIALVAAATTRKDPSLAAIQKPLLDRFQKIYAF